MAIPCVYFNNIISSPPPPFLLLPKKKKEKKTQKIIFWSKKEKVPCFDLVVAKSLSSTFHTIHAQTQRDTCYELSPLASPAAPPRPRPPLRRVVSLLPRKARVIW